MTEVGLIGIRCFDGIWLGAHNPAWVPGLLESSDTLALAMLRIRSAGRLR